MKMNVATIALLAFTLLICNIPSFAQECNVSVPTSIEINKKGNPLPTLYFFTLQNKGTTSIIVDSVVYATNFLYPSTPGKIGVSATQVKAGDSIKIDFLCDYVYNVDATTFVTVWYSCGCNRIPIQTIVQIKTGYSDYADVLTHNKVDTALQASLNSYVKNHLSLGYKAAREVMFGTADNVNDTVECIYTGRKLRTTGIPPNGEFNTEHIWAQSRGSSIEPNKSDIHHLAPTYPNANTIRASYPFGNATKLWRDAGGGSKLGYTENNDTVFEPRDVAKGNIARSMFYYVCRYGNLTGFIGNPYNMEPTLKAWNKLDAPDTLEQKRNTAIERAQGKRNPFIDHPELADLLFIYSKPTRAQLASTGMDISFSSLHPISGNSVQIALFNPTIVSDTIKNIAWRDVQTPTFSFKTTYDTNVDSTRWGAFQSMKLDIALESTNSSHPDENELIVQLMSGEEKRIKVSRCSAPLSVAENHRESSSIILENFPQPCTESTRIFCNFVAHEILSVRIYTLDGREVLDASNRIEKTLNGAHVEIKRTEIEQFGQALLYTVYTKSGSYSRILIL